MTRIEAIKMQVASDHPWTVEVKERDLRDLLDLYDAIKALEIYARTDEPLRTSLRAVLSRLDAEVEEPGR